LRIFLEKRCDKADDRIVCLDLRIGADQSARDGGWLAGELQVVGSWDDKKSEPLARKVRRK
jgi:hypothetical protein